MKHLTILRHAKASNKPIYDRDFDRPLTGKGRKQAPTIARVLAASKVTPDLLLSSPAVRARETAELVAETIGYTKAIAYEEAIYGASAATLLEILRGAPDAAEHIVLIGHNPGLENLVSGLCAGTNLRLNLRLPTAGMAQLAPQVVRWRQLRWGAGELQLLIAPRFLKRL